MGKYTSVWQFVRPDNDKVIDWSAEWKAMTQLPTVAAEMAYHHVTMVPLALDSNKDHVGSCLTMFRRGMDGTIGYAHCKRTPNFEKMYYITLSREWWKAMKQMLPPEVFTREFEHTMAHEYAHILMFTQPDRALMSHSYPWQKLAQAMGDDGVRCIDGARGKWDSFVKGSQVRWITINRKVDEMIQKQKADRLQAQLAAAAQRYAK